MEQENFNCVMNVEASAGKAFNDINHVSEWWMKNTTGDPQNLDGHFTVHFGGPFVDFKITDFIPDKRVEWLVTDCDLPWLKDTKEWNDTKVVFEISEKNNATQINFTHVGLVPEIECYDSCVKGWTQYVTGSLQKLINEGKGLPG
jgi:hypothetical protein